MSTLETAAKCYLDRKARRTHPAGNLGKGGRWTPAPEERRSCCNDICRPSRAWPWTLNRHCRSLEHVAALFEVDALQLRRKAAELAYGK